MPMKPLSHAQRLAAARPDTHGRVVSDRENHEQRALDPVQREADRLRGSGRWKRLRLVKLRQQPLCEECLRHDETRAACDVDHVVPVVELLRRGTPERVFALEGLQSLCRACHCQKTARELAARSRPLSSRDVDAMAAVLSHVEHLPLAEARARIESSLARGEKHLEVRDA